MIDLEEQITVRPSLAALELDSGSTCSGRVVRFEGDSIELGFAPDEAPLLAIAQVVVLRLRLDPACKELCIPVRVIARADDDAQRRYELQPRRVDDLARLNGSDRRKCMRVLPRADAPIDVELRDHTGRHLGSGRVIDISAKGVGVVLEASDDLSLLAHERLLIAIRLPDDTRRIVVPGVVRARRLVGVLVRVGIQFEIERTPKAEENQKRLMRYVFLRQAEMAAVERGTKPAA